MYVDVSTSQGSGPLLTNLNESQLNKPIKSWQESNTENVFLTKFQAENKIESGSIFTNYNTNLSDLTNFTDILNDNFHHILTTNCSYISFLETKIIHEYLI